MSVALTVFSRYLPVTVTMGLIDKRHPMIVAAGRRPRGAA
jgi:hypothetical protein